MNSNMINLACSCGLPCELVLRIIDELRHKMIHIQNWKIYASHYNDDTSELGLELKKAQHDYKMYGEKMGVPITEDIAARAKRPSVTIKNRNILISDSKVCWGKSAAIAYEIIM
jgi:hypothetical protein